jgi:hypothetical protein
VAKQIATGLAGENLTAEYEYQGSVTKNTHIKAYSITLAKKAAG